MTGWVRKHRWLLLGIGAVVVIGVVWKVATSRPEVLVAEAARGPLRLQISASGLVEIESADLGFERSGRILRLYVREGDAVAATELLARIASVSGLPDMDGNDDVIQAPYDATVVSIYRREGAVVAPAEPILRLVAEGRPWVTAFINSEDAAYLRPGQKLQCRAGGYLSEPTDIVVRAVGKEAVARPDLPGSARQVRVRCDVLELPFPLAPGTEVDIDGEVLLEENALFVPTAAVVTEGVDDWVWAVDDGKVARREVALGANNFALIHIRRGLEPGEKVVVHGKQGLTEGQRVRTKPMPAAAGQ